MLGELLELVAELIVAARRLGLARGVEVLDLL
jgi:hypothetical protein